MENKIPHESQQQMSTPELDQAVNEHLKRSKDLITEAQARRKEMHPSGQEQEDEKK